MFLGHAPSEAVNAAEPGGVETSVRRGASMQRYRVGATVAALFLLVGAPVGLAAEQERSYKWWQSGRVKTELNLSTDQSARLEEVFQSLAPRLKDAKANLERQETEMSRLLDAVAEEGQVMQQVDRVEAARSELGKTRALMLYRMHRLLTPDQRVKLKAMHDAWERDHRRRPDAHR